MPVKAIWRLLKVVLAATALFGIVGFRDTLSNGILIGSSKTAPPPQTADGETKAEESDLSQDRSLSSEVQPAEEKAQTSPRPASTTGRAVGMPASMSIRPPKKDPSRLFRSPGARQDSPMPECHAEPWPESFIDAVIYVRLQSQDINHNVLRWIQWAWWSGVRKVYLFDTAIKPEDRKLITLPGIPELIDVGLVTLADYPLVAKGVPAFCQKQIALVKEANTCWPTLGWRFYLDFDEFLFKPADTAQDWLRRYVQAMPSKVSLVLICNIIFGGQRIAPDSKTPMPQGLGKIKSRPEIYFYRKPFSFGSRDTHTKVLGRPSNMSHVDVHTASPSPGYIAIQPQCEEIRFNHYWGPRVSVMEGMVHDQSMEAPLLNARKAFQAEFGIF